MQQEQDRYIMQLAVDGRFKLGPIQQCRLYLKVVTLADVFNAAGDQLEPWAFKGPGRDSLLSWPKQGQPSKQAWAEWRKLLRSLLSTYGLMVGKYIKPVYRLGKWISTHQKWKWSGNSRHAIHKDGRRYRRDGIILTEMESNMQLVKTPTYPLQVSRRRGQQLIVWDANMKQIPARENTEVYSRLKGEL